MSQNKPTLMERVTAIGRATLYDAKMTTLAINISIAVAKSRNYIKSLSIFANNLSALYMIINLKKEASQIKAI